MIKNIDCLSCADDGNESNWSLSLPSRSITDWWSSHSWGILEAERTSTGCHVPIGHPIARCCQLPTNCLLNFDVCGCLQTSERHRQCHIMEPHPSHWRCMSVTHLSVDQEKSVLLAHCLHKTNIMSRVFIVGAEKLLRHLKNAGVPICLATSSHRRHVDIKTTNHKEVFELFDHQVTGELYKNLLPCRLACSFSEPELHYVGRKACLRYAISIVFATAIQAVTASMYLLQLDDAYSYWGLFL